MTAYYNEIDPYAAAWLRNLISKGLIADGEVDERSITEVKPEELRGFTQCHFFAGIGGWSRALRLSRWDDERPVWTGSCPCQPFSTAGKQKGKIDDRHLWPIWFNLIKECKPTVVFGEQVEAAIAHGWLDDVVNDLEAENYSVGSAVLPACSVGSPHRRNRLWFVGNAEHNGPLSRTLTRSDSAAVCNHAKRENSSCEPERRNTPVTMADTKLYGPLSSEKFGSVAKGKDESWMLEPERRNTPVTMADTSDTGLQGHGRYEQQHGAEGWKEQAGHHWSSGVFIDCPDGKQRLIEPSIPLLVNRVPARVGRLRAYGNAIVPQVAATFIKAFQESKRPNRLMEDLIGSRIHA